MSGGAKRDLVRAGFIPLIDAAPLVAASELGFARAEGLDIELMRETSWATIRDRLAVRHLDAAHMLGPMPIADSLGLTPLPVGLVVPMALGYAGNTITVVRHLLPELMERGGAGNFDAAANARAFAGLVAGRKAAGKPRLVMAIVHPFSAHYYQLAYWLAWAGVRPRSDVDLVVIPPSLMAAALESGGIDGFCVGEPWGSAAVASGAGHVLTTSAHIWNRSPDKMLGVRKAFAGENPDRLERLVRAVYRAACWCDDPGNHAELARLLAQPQIVNQPVAVVQTALARRTPGPAGPDACGADFQAFARAEATFPRLGHADWYYGQMLRWEQAHDTAGDGLARARSSYRPDIWRAALAHVTDTSATLAEDALFDGTSILSER